MSTNTKDLRNVVLLGHSGSGKTTICKTMLYEGGAIKRGTETTQHRFRQYRPRTRTRKHDFLIKCS